MRSLAMGQVRRGEGGERSQPRRFLHIQATSTCRGRWRWRQTNLPGRPARPRSARSASCRRSRAWEIYVAATLWGFCERAWPMPRIIRQSRSPASSSLLLQELRPHAYFLMGLARRLRGPRRRLAPGLSASTNKWDFSSAISSISAWCYYCAFSHGWKYYSPDICVVIISRWVTRIRISQVKLP